MTCPINIFFLQNSLLFMRRKREREGETKLSVCVYYKICVRTNNALPFFNLFLLQAVLQVVNEHVQVPLSILMLHMSYLLSLFCNYLRKTYLLIFL